MHEGALADLESVDKLRTQLARSCVGIAYDDFGAGQARLLELAEVPPHYLKFDMSFVRGIDSAPASRQRLLSSLVSVARDLLRLHGGGGRRDPPRRPTSACASAPPTPGLLLRPPAADRGDIGNGAQRSETLKDRPGAADVVGQGQEDQDHEEGDARGDHHPVSLGL